MQLLETIQCEVVAGGFLAAIGALVLVFTLPHVVDDSAKKYNQWGHDLGEATWEHFHPYDPNR